MFVFIRIHIGDIFPNQTVNAVKRGIANISTRSSAKAIYYYKYFTLI